MCSELVPGLRYRHRFASASKNGFYPVAPVCALCLACAKGAILGPVSFCQLLLDGYFLTRPVDEFQRSFGPEKDNAGANPRAVAWPNTGAWRWLDFMQFKTQELLSMPKFELYDSQPQHCSARRRIHFI